jgi:hypothetical protein
MTYRTDFRRHLLLAACLMIVSVVLMNRAAPTAPVASNKEAPRITLQQATARASVE